MDHAQLRALPKVDALMRQPALQEACLTYGYAAVLRSTRDVLQQTRDALLQANRGSVDVNIPTPDLRIEQRILDQCATSAYSLIRVINATGILLHTNLGRAVLGARAAAHVQDIATHYSNLEYDCAAGTRGSRHVHAEQALIRLCGCESAMVVNNNAAAVLLILTALCAQKEVIVSRGELVEIGGSFRVPEIMRLSGATLCEVGTTNKTRIGDYQAAITPQTAALLKVHTSNYKIFGFVEQANLPELVALGKAHDLPVIYDIGSGWFDDLHPFCHDEPNVLHSLASGVDLLCFSGDKLLGGTQAGIVVGKKKYIDLLKQHPLARALRIDKLSLAALEGTLWEYQNQTALQGLPTLAMLATPIDVLQERAQAMAAALQAQDVDASALPTQGQIGGGSLPAEQIPSFAVAILFAQDNDLRRFEQSLRTLSTPIIARISKHRLLLDMRTLAQSDLPYVQTALINCYRAISSAAHPVKGDKYDVHAAIFDGFDFISPL